MLGAQVLGHKGPVLAVAAAPAVCYSGGADGTLRAWELPELKPLCTFESKDGGRPVRAVVVVAGLVVSGSETGVLRVHGGCHEAQPPEPEPELVRGACGCNCAIS